MSSEPANAHAPLVGRLILLGVTGSISAYKAAELCRALMAAGAEVQPLMTNSGARFLGPLTLETLTRRAVMLDPLELLPDSRIAHIVAADTADLIVVAPATARWIAAMANGLADDVVTATTLASSAPVVVAPAMDGEMYGHPATRANVETLRGFGYVIVEPTLGPLASGAVGRGRLAETAEIMAAVARRLEGRPIRQSDAKLRPPTVPGGDGTLEDRHVVVTAGGTAEPIDPVRYIGNRSTGKMGAAVAEAALQRGAHVTLIHGLTSVPLPAGAELVPAPSTAAMHEAVLATLPSADVVVMAAAVADFRPRRAAAHKLARNGAVTLELESTPDILADAVAHASAHGRAPVFVGFAAETGSLDRAADKVARKRVDLLVANDVLEDGSGFASDTNRVSVLGADGAREDWPMMSKREVADRLLERVVGLLESREAAATRFSGAVR